MFEILVDVPHITAELLSDLSARNIGIELSHFALPENLAPQHLDEKVSAYADLLKDFKGGKTAHGAFYDLNIVSREPKIRQVCFERMVESLVIADSLGMKEVVFHTNYKAAANDKDWQRRWLDMQVDYWGRLAEIAADNGQVCLLENTTEPSPDYLFYIADQLRHDSIKICLDTGHTRCFTNTNIGLGDWAAGLGDYLACIHLHTNRGTKDEHLAFNHAEGVLDFAPFFAYLEKMPTLPKIVIEVKTRQDYEDSYQGLKAKNYITSAPL